MRKSGEMPELIPQLYVRETVFRGVSRSLGKPEKAGRLSRPFYRRERMSQKTYAGGE